MVGYNPKENITPNQKIIAGCMSGAMSRLITQPLDVIKVRTQLSKRREEKRRFMKVTRRIFHEEGYKAFFHGHVLGQKHAILAYGTQFYFYELLTRFMFQHSLITNPTINHTVCGTIAGTASVVIVSPIEVIRVRQIVHKEQYSSLIQGAKMVYRSGGIKGFYEGLSASMLQVGPAVGISFTVFGIVHHRVLKYLKTNYEFSHTRNVTLASFIAGALAGFISKTITYPLDLTKRRLQIATHVTQSSALPPSTARKLIKCENLTSCLSETWRREGIFGLYRGWKITVYKACLTSVVVFTTYEHMCALVKSYSI